MMTEPSATSSRQAIAAGVAAVILFAGVGFVVGRASVGPDTPPAAPAAPVAVPAPATAPPAPRLLSRADLLTLTAVAADAAASATMAPQPVADAAGQRFTLYLPFGCTGPATEHDTRALSWRIDSERNLLKLRIIPKSWAISEWWPVNPPLGAETATGFWVTRPWSSAETCPPIRATIVPGALPLVLPGQTLAIAQLVRRDSPRQILRDDKPLEADIRLPVDFTPPAGGFRVRLTGKIDRPRNALPVRCVQPAGAEQRPICLIAAVFEELAVENSDTGETVASWSLNG